jgi:hypothetical protein
MERFERFYGGLAWPVNEIPAYYCLFGQLNEKNKLGKRPLIQIFEMQDTEGSVNNFFSWVKDISEQFGVYDAFADIENVAWYEKFVSVHFHILGRVTGAQDFNYGLQIIKSWAKADALKTMEGSLLRSQLASLRETELKEVSEKFNAVNGLRFLVTGVDDVEEGRTRFDDLDMDSVCV